MAQEIAESILDEVSLILNAKIRGSQQVDFIVASHGDVTFEQVVKLLGLDHIPELLRNADHAFIVVLGSHHVQEVVEHVGYLLHLHVVVATACHHLRHWVCLIKGPSMHILTCSVHSFKLLELFHEFTKILLHRFRFIIHLYPL